MCFHVSIKHFNSKRQHKTFRVFIYEQQLTETPFTWLAAAGLMTALHTFQTFRNKNTLKALSFVLIFYYFTVSITLCWLSCKTCWIWLLQNKTEESSRGMKTFGTLCASDTKNWNRSISCFRNMEETSFKTKLWSTQTEQSNNQLWLKRWIDYYQFSNRFIVNWSKQTLKRQFDEKNQQTVQNT